MAQWTASFEGPACNGDVVVRAGKGRLVAVIYAINARPNDPDTMKRAQDFIAKCQPTWCDTCGRDTDGSRECDTCAEFWRVAESDPRISVVSA